MARWIAIGCGVCGAGIVIYAAARRETADAEAFFEAGSLLLIAGIAAASAWLSALAGRDSEPNVSFAGLGLRGCARRRKRSLVTIALLAMALRRRSIVPPLVGSRVAAPRPLPSSSPPCG